MSASSDPTGSAPVPAADPVAAGERLAAAFRGIGDRSMRDLPIYNASLDVAPVGFQVYDGGIVGVLITPWFMNLIVIAHDGNFANAASGSTVRYVLPAGAMDFVVGQVDAFGKIASCSLISPMFCFTDMATARATADAALGEIMRPHAAGATSGAAAPSVAIDRRRFLRGEIAGPSA